jgi:hypothetical protein
LASFSSAGQEVCIKTDSPLNRRLRLGGGALVVLNEQACDVFGSRAGRTMKRENIGYGTRRDPAPVVAIESEHVRKES